MKSNKDFGGCLLFLGFLIAGVAVGWALGGRVGAVLAAMAILLVAFMR